MNQQAPFRLLFQIIVLQAALIYVHLNYLIETLQSLQILGAMGKPVIKSGLAL